MRSPFAALRTLVLPAGATSGTRLILDGVNGRILAFGPGNDLIGRMEPVLGNMFIGSISPSGARAELVAAGSQAELSLDPPDWVGHTLVAARVLGDIDTGLGRPLLLLVSPTVDGGDECRVFILGERTNGAQPAVLIDGETQDADVVLNGRSIPRGLLANGYFADSGNDSARAAGAATDMTVTVALVGGRLNRVALNTQLVLGTAGVPYALELEHDGTVVGRFDRINEPMTTGAGGLTHYVSASVDYLAPSDDAAATLRLANGSGSGGTIECRAPTGGGDRTLTVSDIGRP